MTGSNKGIGFAIVKELCAKFDGVVYLTSRNEELGRVAVAELEKLGLHPRYHQLDIDDESSVLRLRDYLKSIYGGLNVLVNNAGICFWPDCGKTVDQVAALTLATNYFSTLTASQILLPLLRPGARVVNLSSSFGHLSAIPGRQLRDKFASSNLTVEELDGLMRQYIEQVLIVSVHFTINMSKLCLRIAKRDVKIGKHAERGWPADEASAYRVSKVGISALTRIQQRQFDQDPRPDIIVNSVHPGSIATDLNRHLGIGSIEQGKLYF